MKSKIFMLLVIFGLMTSLNASAEEAEERVISGKATVTGEILDFEGEKAKFNEYRDIRTGFTGDVDLQYEKKSYYIDFNAREVARKDQSYELYGGKWGSFEYDFKYDQLPHNLTENAKTFYSGYGDANLTYTAAPPSTFLPNSNFTTWNTFDYSTERKNYGGGVQLDMLKPFFFGVSVAREERTGVVPIGAAGTSPGGISLELPSPINYQTDTVKLEAGYLKNPLSLAFSYTYGQFDNDNRNLNFRNPATANTAATTDAFTLPPDNNYFKLDFKGGLKLPWNSKFNANVSYARNESQENLFQSYVTDTTAAASNIGEQGRTGILLSRYVFDGKVNIQNYNFVLTSRPVHFLDGKVFYKYYQTNNQSSQIITTDPGPAPVGVTPAVLNNQDRLFDYSNYKFGAELGFKLPLSFYLLTGYTRGHTSRKRPDIPSYDDDLYEAELKWSGVEWMVARGGYEWLHRKADFHGPEVTGPSDPNVIENYFQRSDAASKDSYAWKASVEIYPIEAMTLGVGYKWKDVPYSDNVLGLLSRRSEEWHLDGEYLILKRVRLYGYFDFEYAKLDQKQRTFTSGTTANPALAPTPTNFNWTVTETERNYAYAVGSDVYAIPDKLTFKFQYNFVKSQGFADYTYLLGANPLPPTRTQDNIDLGNLDDYRLSYFLVKATYNPIKPLSLSLGYAYEKYIYDDDQYNGYQYVPTSSLGGVLGYLSGAYANQNYRANIFFASASYLF